jgi:prophage regulatory protein
MTQTQSDTIIASTLPELLTIVEVADLLHRTRSGVYKLRARDPSFPKPYKDGNNRRSRIYFVRQEIEAYLTACLHSRERI